MTNLESKLNIRIINLKKAIRDNRSKDVVRFKYQEYIKEYFSDTRTLKEKLDNHSIYEMFEKYIGEKK